MVDINNSVNKLVSDLTKNEKLIYCPFCGKEVWHKIMTDFGSDMIVCPNAPPDKISGFSLPAELDLFINNVNNK